MADPKDIGKAFKERLRDFDESPSKLAWEDIEAELPKKGNNTMVYWIKVVGAPILFILLIFFASEKYKSIKHKKPLTNNATENAIEIEDCIETVIEENNKKLSENNKFLKSKSDANYSQIDTIKHTQSSFNDKDKKYPIGLSVNKRSSSSNQITANSSTWTSKNKIKEHLTRRRNNTSSEKSDLKNISNYPESAINPNNSHQGAPKPKNGSQTPEENETKNGLSNEYAKTPENKNLSETKNKQIAIQSAPQKDSLITKKSKDTLIYMFPLKKKIFRKFSLALHAIPTYTIPTGGSLISDRLSENSNNGRVSLNFGLLTTMYLTEKTALRIGYSRLKLSNKIKNVSTNQLPEALGDTGIFLSNNEIIENSEEVDLTQKIMYDNISLGLQYEIIDNRIKTSLIGGVSFLLLNKNSITIHTSSDDFEFESNSNIVKASLSADFGVNFQYKLSKKIFFNVEPLINYQFQNASDNSKSYRHLYFTIQTGFSYEF